MNSVGASKEEIDTPALLADLDLIEQNILTMSNYLKNKKTKLRAHTKVHRIPPLALKQLKAGAKGLCCQKVSEAEVMAASGVKDIIVTNEIVTPQKIMRLVTLTKSAHISVPIDNEYNAQCVSKIAMEEGAEVNALVDVHLGSQRCGVEPGEPALKLARSICALKGLKFTGLMGFEGHLSWIEPRMKRREEIEKTESLLLKTKSLLEDSGIHVEEISTGSAGTYDVTANNSEITELQA
jgi:D-serine deaminase-like pyridoxal phosphate-dependent protein